MAFEFSDKNLNRLERAISSERLTPYRVRARGDLWVALHLYSRNTELSEALYGVVQGFEVFLRNATHARLTSAFGTEMWWEKASLRDRERDDVSDAIQNIEERSSVLIPGKIVAELNLGFWTNLYSNYYERDLWVPFLRSSFPIHMQRKRLHDRLDRLKILRNRIAHHESLVRRDVQQDYRELLETVGWMSPTVRSWIESTNCFEERYVKRIPKRENIPEANEL
ncbi:MAG TPA: hypothetical protein VIJ79_02730 [Acidobacteriaceae bacterium]